MRTLEEIRTEIERAAGYIGAVENDLPTYRIPDGDGRPHVEVDDRGYHYVTSERGVERERRTTDDFYELLYWVFKDATFILANRLPRTERVPGQDSRRALFRKQRELMAVLSPAWADRIMEHHREVLRNHPFEDAAGS